MMLKDLPQSGANGVDPTKIGQSDLDRLRPIRLTAAIFAGGLSLLALLAGAFNYGMLTSPVLGLTEANPLAAVAFILTALALTIGPCRHTLSVRILAALIAGLGATELIQPFVGKPFGTGQLLFPDQFGRAFGPAASTMPSATALSLILMGGALFVSGSRYRTAILASQIGCVVVVAIALFAAAGHVLDVIGLNGAIRIPIPFNSTLILCRSLQPSPALIPIAN